MSDDEKGNAKGRHGNDSPNFEGEAYVAQWPPAEERKETDVEYGVYTKVEREGSRYPGDYQYAETPKGHWRDFIQPQETAQEIINGGAQPDRGSMVRGIAADE